MNGALFRSLRECLGLSRAWVALKAGVQERTVEYWESGKKEPPLDIVENLIELDFAFEENSQRIADDKESGSVLVRFKTDEDLGRFLPEYKSLTAVSHASFVFRTYCKMRLLKKKVGIEYVDCDAYFAWLNGRKSTSSLLDEWAMDVFRPKAGTVH